MSRQPSPSPAHPGHSNPPYQLHAVASSSSAPATANNGAPKPQQKPKGFAPGITASAEDVKYQTKYKELKRKVKEIELDNDKLYLKLLLAKKNIRRMNLERAILYERLAAVPPTPGRHPQELPPEQDPVFAPQQPPQDHPRGLDANDHALSEYMHAHPTARLIQGPEGNIIAIEDTPVVDSRGPVAMSGPPPPHGIPLVQNFQHESGPGYDPQRPLPALPPVAGLTPAGPMHDSYLESAQQQHQELPPLSSSRSSGGLRERGDYDRDRDRDRDRDGDHAPLPGSGWQGPPQSNNSSLSRHRRDRSRRRHSRVPSSSHTLVGSDLDSAPHEGEPGGRLDTLPPVHRSRRPSVSESEGRGRRHDLHELSHHQQQQQQQHGVGHGYPLAPPHIQLTPSIGPGSPPPPQTHSPNANRPTGRHNHQRVGPGAHIHRERDPEYDRELYHARELERMEEAERARELTIRERLAMEEEMRSGGAQQWVRDEQGLTGPGIPHGGRSRSDTPNSNDASRPPSGQSYERDQRAPHGGAYGSSRNLLGLDGGNVNSSSSNNNNNDYYDRELREDRGHGGAALDSRKRSRNDMEVDSDRERDRERVDPRYADQQQGPHGSAAPSAARMEGNRGSKRMHHDDRDRDGQMSSVRDEGPMDQDD